MEGVLVHNYSTAINQDGGSTKKVKAVSTSEHLFTFGKSKERKSRKCCVISGQKNSEKFLKNSSTDNV